MSRTKIDYSKHIKGWADSGQSKAAYCREHGLTYHCFLYRVKRAEDPMVGNKNFVRITPGPVSGDRIEYYRPDGGRFIFPVSYPVEQILKLTGAGC